MKLSLIFSRQLFFAIAIFISFAPYTTAKAQESEAAILLVSIDGYRHDYTQMYSPPFLSRFSKEGASLKSLVPSYPSKTYPNHVSIITGRYPSKHGIVANSFIDPESGRSYSLGNREAVKDGYFYTAKPFWNLAQENGILSAPYFWPGSEAAIGGTRPSYWVTYDQNASHDERVEKVVNYFKMPKSKRPRFVTLYFSDVDSAGHTYGPRSPETQEAVLAVDQALAKLHEKLSMVAPELNIIIVSDHGMGDLEGSRHQSLGSDKRSLDLLNKFKAKGHGPLVHLYKKSDEVDLNLALDIFNERAQGYMCYFQANVPEHFNFRDNPRIGDIVCLAEEGYSISALGDAHIPHGNHGWYPGKVKDMHGVFYAQGPAFIPGEYESSANIHIYPLMAKILGIEVTHEIDGRAEVLSPMLYR